MRSILPMSDLRNRFAEIIGDVCEDCRSAILTLCGRGDMAVSSIEPFDDSSFRSEVPVAPREAGRAMKVDERFSPDGVLSETRSVAVSIRL